MEILRVFITACVIEFVLGEKILAFVSSPSISHHKLIEKLYLELANKGHEVTIITPFERLKPVPRLKETFLPDLSEEFMGTWRTNSKITSEIFRFGKWVKYATLLCTVYMTPRYMDAVLSRSELQNFLNKEENFDLIIGETFYDEAILAGFSYKYKAPILAVAGFFPTDWANHLIGNPAPASYIPEPHLGFNDKMSFWERTENTIYGLLSNLLYRLYCLRKHDAVLKKYFGNQAPHLKYIMKNTSLILVNNHFSLSFPRPSLPNMVDIGGFHVDSPKSLQADLKKYLDGSKKGVILFSTGSIMKSSELPDELKKAILGAFSKLENDVMWTSDDDNLKGLPKNVKIFKWIPQSDVLAHPNLKLFITHGGMLSTTEAIARGVPMVGVPIFSDQFLNTKCLQAAGYGLTLNFVDLTEDTLYDAITEVLNNHKYKENVKKGSVLMQDRSVRPIDTAIYWIEYVIRHKGAPHLRSAVQDLTWYQIYLLDVLAFIFTLIFIAFKVTKFFIKISFQKKIVTKHKKEN